MAGVQLARGVRSGRNMTHILRTAFVAAAFLVASGAASAQGQTQNDRGMKVYADQKCALCHAIGGKGNAKGALDAVGSRLKAEEIREWVVHPAEMTKKMKAERKPQMKAYPNLSKEDLDALVSYLVSLKKK
jgi:mono/diheme cytochrome c family protein